MENLKYTLSILLLLIAIIARGTTHSGNLSFTFSEDDYSFSYDENGYLHIDASDLSYYPEANEPGLPKISTDVVISGECQHVSTNFRLTKRLIRSNVLIASSPIPVSTDNVLDNYQVYPTFYNQSVVYPTSNCQYVSYSKWEDQTVLHYLSCPFIYDASAKKLYFIDSIDVEITVSYQEKTINKEFGSNSIEFDGEIINSSLFSKIYNNRAKSNSKLNRIDYVIVTSEELESAFEPLIRWKKTKGLYSQILTIEDIDSKYQGNDIQEKLKNCFYDLYKNSSLKFVLLGGDDTIVPVRRCYAIVNGNSSNPTSDSTIPTDLYYACFDGNFGWDEYSGTKSF